MACDADAAAGVSCGALSGAGIVSHPLPRLLASAAASARGEVAPAGAASAAWSSTSMVVHASADGVPKRTTRCASDFAAYSAACSYAAAFF
ncbi:MAG: hypothetical protein SOI38_09210 [Eggerthellaceae bacterium]